MHGLFVHYRVQFKGSTVIFKALCSLRPSYLTLYRIAILVLIRNAAMYFLILSNSSPAY